ncbi:hypothetical protein [Bradyrhizobium sp. LA6.12]|uniref:hypothetical protein n=1 Tax=unclassified Bradyrhizobium TaxID=2631580 RepID=UPI003399F603
MPNLRILALCVVLGAVEEATRGRGVDIGTQAKEDQRAEAVILDRLLDDATELFGKGI